MRDGEGCGGERSTACVDTMMTVLLCVRHQNNILFWPVYLFTVYHIYGFGLSSVQRPVLKSSNGKKRAAMIFVSIIVIALISDCRGEETFFFRFETTFIDI